MTSREPAATVPADTSQPGAPRDVPRPERDPVTAAAVVSGQPLITTDPWHTLSQLTEARIALGRAGSSLPTTPLLQFAADHAMARDAIHTAFHTDDLARALADLGFPTLIAHSQAATRAEYLRRPDLGRLLDEPSRIALTPAEPASPKRLCVIIADGLSPLAPMRNAVPLLEHLRPGLAGWSLDAVILATEARVALADEIGQIRGAEATLILIGERPGLKSPDSLGAYLTYRPQPGRTDAERNCVSNIRAGGLAPAEAAARLLRLLNNARTLGASGVCLKDEISSAQLPSHPTVHLPS